MTPAPCVRPRHRPRRLLAAASCAAAVCAAALAPSTALADDFGELPHRSYELHAAGMPGLVADVAWWSTEPGGEMVTWHSHGGANQQWEFMRTMESRTGEAAYRIKSRHSGLCLSMAFGNSNVVIQQPCRPGDEQLWRIQPSDNGTYMIENDWWRVRYLRSSGDPGTPLTLERYWESGVRWRLPETKLPYVAYTAGVSLPWGQHREETADCDAGWRVERDANSTWPRYEYVGDNPMSSVRGETYQFQAPPNRWGMEQIIHTPYNIQRIHMIYYNAAYPFDTRTGRVRFFCVPS